MDIISTSEEASIVTQITIDMFAPKNHLNMVNEWLEGYGLNTLDADSIPEVGYILKENNNPIACALLFQDKSAKTGWIEGCIANPDVPKGSVVNNFHFCIDFIEDHAKSIGVKYLEVFTSIPTHSREFAERGFNVISRCVALRKELV